MGKIFFMIALFLIAPETIFGQTFHAIIFANTKSPGNPNRPGDKGIGPSVTIDFERMGIEMTTIAKSIGYKLKKYYYYDTPESFSRSSLENLLSNFSCAHNDIVFFYYSGHGLRAEDEKTEFPEMSLKVPYGPADISQLYPLYNVYSEIRKMSPRLTIVMGDLCNTEMKGFFREESSRSKGVSVLSKNACDVYRNLFLNVKGGLIAASSKPFVTSTCLQNNKGEDLGSNFTFWFLELLQYCVMENQNVSWNDLLDAVTEKTRQYLVKDNNGNKVPQTPVYRHELTSASAPMHTEQEITTPPQAPSSSNDAATNMRDEIAYSLSMVCNQSVPKLERIRNIPKAKNYFENTQIRVQVVGFDNRTIVNTCGIGEYLNYLSIATKMDQVVVLETQKNDTGKIIYMKVHEIHYQ